jgi:hypothetical protein
MGVSKDSSKFCELREAIDARVKAFQEGRPEGWKSRVEEGGGFLTVHLTQGLPGGGRRVLNHTLSLFREYHSKAPLWGLEEWLKGLSEQGGG